MGDPSRLTQTFAACREQGRAALVGYLTAFDPSREQSLSRLRTAVESGVDILELGVPFSDPTADGTAVQGAMLRARAAGATLTGVLELATELRQTYDGPIVLFSYANPLLQRGDALGPALVAAGIDAVLLVDLPPEHAAELRDPLAAHGIEWVSLVAPTTGADRLPGVAGCATGFVYAVTLRGVTGATLDANSEDLAAQLQAVRAHASRPVVAGFGIRTPDQAAVLAQHADGVVVGTALIEAAQRGDAALAETVRGLAGALTWTGAPPR